MKFKLSLSDTQLRILAPVFQFFVVFSGINILFCIALAAGLENVGVAPPPSSKTSAIHSHETCAFTKPSN